MSNELFNSERYNVQQRRLAWARVRVAAVSLRYHRSRIVPTTSRWVVHDMARQDRAAAETEWQDAWLELGGWWVSAAKQ